MKIQLTKANSFQIEDGKKYLVIINTDLCAWEQAQKEDIEYRLAALNMTAVFLPKGTTYKVVEANDTAGEKV
jgi:hypothetical protein